MTASCICPDLLPVESIPAEPLRCGCCGQPLELTCAGHCGQEHVARAFRDASTPRPALGARGSYRKSGAPRKPMAWREKPCAGCTTLFAPTGGRDTHCPRCKANRILGAVPMSAGESA